MLAYFDVPLSWSELGRRTLRETQADDGPALAAQLAYYFFLALFPALLFLLALASFFPMGHVIERLIDALQGVAPQEVVTIIRDQLKELSATDSGGILTFGVVAALWSSSAALVALIDALNRAYDVEDGRSWIRRRITAVLLTLGVAVFMLLSAVLVVAGPELADLIASRVGLGPAFEWAWKLLQWPIVFALVAIAIALIYYFGPDVDQDFVFLTPGSVLATLLWLGASLGFRVYVVNFGSYNETYGALGGVMVLMLWLYLSGLAVVVGAEMNAEIEHASPYGKAEGEKVPGERRRIGPLAARHAREQLKTRGTPPAQAGRAARQGGDMNSQGSSIADVLRTAIHDFQDLVRTELALAKAELRQEVQRLRTAFMAVAIAAVAGLLAVVFVLAAIALAISDGLDWPLWAGFGIVAVVAGVAAGVLAMVGRRRMTTEHMPLTTETLKENAQWIKARTS